MLPFSRTAPAKKRRTLDQAQVVAAALRLLDEVGLDELTMRRLAEKLGVQAASLYRHVRNKEELVVLLADEIAAEIPHVPAEGTWQQKLTRMAESVRAGLRRHRDGARVLAETPPAGPRRLQHIEAVLSVLRSAGFTAEEAAQAAYHCNNFVTEFAADEARFEACARAAGMTRNKLMLQTRRMFRALPADQYPTLVELADHLAHNDSDALFRFGLETWIRGLECVLAARRGQ